MAGAGIEDHRDAYGAELKAYLQKGETLEIVERDDGLIDAHNGIPLYFASIDQWPQLDRQAVAMARGRVLDIGCGAGRVALYLQERGEGVTAIDNSPGAVDVCRQRGVRDARLLSITGISRTLGLFGSVTLFGNNFGLFGSPKRARWLLRRLRGMTTADGIIIANSTDPYATADPDHLRYHRYNRGRNRLGGQLRIRVRHRAITGPWFDYLFVSLEELESILDNSGWRIREILTGEGPGYFMILEKDDNQDNNLREE